MIKLSKLSAAALACVSLDALATAASAQGCMIGEVRQFGGNFAPRDWALANGQLLSINSNQALFSIIGTIYGGDGRTTFALPDLRGRAPIGPGTGPGLSPRTIGQRVGAATNIISQAQMPPHNHAATTTLTLRATTAASDSSVPTGNALADEGQENIYSEAAPDVDMATGAITATTGVAAGGGNNQPYSNSQPNLTTNYIICLFGTFPSRN